VKLSLSWRDAALALVFLALMFLAVLVGARQDAGDDTPPPLSSYSTAADGTRALALWLEALGHPVRRAEGIGFRLDRDDRLLFVFFPAQGFSPREVHEVAQWVEQGGTLIVATQAWGADALLDHWELDVRFLDDPVAHLGPVQPLLLDPPWNRAEVHAARYWETPRQDSVVYLHVQGRPVLLAFAYGAGRVVASATVYPFTNAGLRDAGNARLVHNLVALAGEGAPVLFDEFHHGYQTARTLNTWLKTSPQGHSLLYAALLIFVYLLAGGRRFGRPISPARATTRRAPVEHIRAMANLLRRGRKRTAILEHYHDRLKRELARSHRLDPTLDDDVFIAQLAHVRPNVDHTETETETEIEIEIEALSRLLRATRQSCHCEERFFATTLAPYCGCSAGEQSPTRQPRVGEGELLRLAQQVDTWLRGAG